MYAHAIRHNYVIFFHAAHTTFNVPKSGYVLKPKVLLSADRISVFDWHKTAVIVFWGDKDFQKPTYRVVSRSWNLSHQKKLPLELSSLFRGNLKQGKCG